MKTLVIAIAGVLALGAGARAQSADASGRWELAIPTNQGVQAVIMVLKKDGEKLTGTLSAAQGEASGEGTQKDSAIVLTFNAKTQQDTFVVSMKATQDGDSMKGTVDRGRGPVDFTGKRGTAQSAAGSSTIDVTGTWGFDVQTSGGTGTPTMIFKQDGEKLTGSYSGLLGEAQLNGTVKGKDITFRIEANLQGTAVVVVYTGTVETPSTMKGTVKLAEMGEGTFTAKKK